MSKALTRRYWFITYNNPPEDWKTALKDIGCEWATGQLEQGQNGTKHIQAVIWFRDRVLNSFWKGKPIYAKALRQDELERSIKYVQKEETRIDGPISIGESPLTKSGRPRATKSGRDYKAALEHLKEGRIKEVEADILIPHFNGCIKTMGLYSEGINLLQPRGLWVYGPPGYGKSHYVRTMYPEAYIKPQNKWWDNYNGQGEVILEDLDKLGACLSHYLKIWADAYKFQAETKGATISPRNYIFALTSNYLPSELWDDATLVEAISRRFKFICFYEKFTPTIGINFGEIPANPNHNINTYFDFFINSQ